MKFLILLFLSINAFANEGDIAYCRSKAKHYGDHKSPDFVEGECYDVIKANTDAEHIIEGNLVRPEIVGAQNMIYVTTLHDIEGVVSTSNRILISGEQSQLKSIQKVRYSKKLKRIFILDKELGGVLSFDESLGGNIAPKRKLIEESLKHADDFILDDEKEEMFVISHSQNWVRVYKMRADIDNNSPEHTVEITRFLDANNASLLGIKGISLSTREDEFYILNIDNSVSVFKKDFNQSTPELLSVIEQSEHGLGNVESIKFIEDKNSLSIRSPAGQIEVKN